jgi:hypothetical protein
MLIYNGKGQAAPSPPPWSWRTRDRAWIFGTGYEALLGVATPGITDGESYIVYGIFPAGEPIPEGESDKVDRYADAATEFHFCQEMTVPDLVADYKASKGRGVIPGHAFWIEPKGEGESAWRCVYVARKGTRVPDLLVLRDKLNRPSRAKLMVALKSHRMAVIRKGIEEGL